MMANKDHNEYMSYFKDIKSLTTIDIPNQPNAIKGNELKEKIKNFENIKYQNQLKMLLDQLIFKKMILF